MVYVLNKDSKVLMPCCNAIARILLKQGKARVIKRTPFVIKLEYLATNYIQPTTLGIDTGSSKIGSSVVDGKGNVLYLSEVEIRNNITDNMSKRAKYRRNRRSRNTRYRKSRWLNRKNSIKRDRFSPTMVSKLNSHLKEINFVKSILPVNKIILETAKCDPHLLKNPALANERYRHFGYQQGTNYGFANTKAFVLDRDGYVCQSCRGKRKDSKLHVHHIVFRSQGGSDDESNLITLCKSCHDDVHRGILLLKKKGKKKGNLKHATQMNTIRVQLLKRINSEETFGFITKENRMFLNLSKEHYNDAVSIASRGQRVNFKTNNLLLKKCISKGDYQQSKGVRSEQRIETGKISSFRKFDKVKYFNNEYFIKGRMSTGYVILMDIQGNKIDFSHLGKGMKTPKMSNLTRISSRKSWIIQQKTIVNI